MSNQEMAKLLSGTDEDRKVLYAYLVGKMQEGFTLTPTELIFLVALKGE